MFRKTLALAMAVGMGSSVYALNRARPAEMVRAHNKWRRAVGVPDIKWSASLATTAQAWANNLEATRGCNLVHSRGRFGENLFWGSAVRYSSGTTEAQTVAPTNVVDAWAGEKQYYTHGTNTCAEGKMCGHYTQVVWKTTTEVGCGSAVCADKSQVWVCNYAPAGNYIGQKPY